MTGADYHIHTARCHHATGDMPSYVQKGIEKGFLELGFSDHAPAGEGFDPDHRMTLDEFPGYVKEIESLRETYGEITLRFGMEADIYDGFEAAIRRLKKKFRPEYTIGSVHIINGIFVFSRENHSLLQNEIHDFIKAYFTMVRNGLRSGLIDVIGHLDGIKWIFPHEKDRITDSACALLRDVRDEGLILELNTSGLRKKPLEMYPSAELLKEAFSLKIPVCFGSDAHHPDEVGSHFTAADSLLRQAGYRKSSRINTLQAYIA